MDYEVMVAAVAGNPVALEKVLAYFDSYINSLCTHAYVNTQDHIDWGVDTQSKTQLQGKLLAAVLRFTL